MIDIRLHTFITLSKTGSFTKTAEILNLTQPAVSQHVKFLEEEYNVSLIKKVGRSFVLTEEGELLLKYAEEIEGLYKALKNALENSSSIVKNYNVGASLTIGEYIMPKIIGEYKRLYDNINILLQVNNTEEIIKKLLRGDIELAAIEGNFDRKKFKYTKFKDDELVLVVSPEHEFAGEKSVNMRDIIAGNLILRERGSGTREIFENKLDEMGLFKLQLKPYMELGSINAIKSLVESNLGYSVISRETVKEEVRQGTLKIVPIEGVRILREFNFVYLKNDKFIDEFINFVIKGVV